MSYVKKKKNQNDKIIHEKYMQNITIEQLKNYKQNQYDNYDRTNILHYTTQFISKIKQNIMQTICDQNDKFCYYR